jgi:N6-adenosine-specific RNA methylase IME4
VINEDLLDLAHEFGKFNVGVFDPPWSYKSKKIRGSFKSGAAQHYDVMSLDSIKALPIERIMQRDSVLMCWVPVPLSYEIARSGIFEKWGFKFKGKVFWEKGGKLLMGHWFRGQVEECWLLKRGKAKPFRSAKRNVIHTHVRKHSQKPDELFEMIEEETEKLAMYDRLELFARGVPRRGWGAYGNEVIYD